MLRFEDFKCLTCGKVEKDIVAPNDGITTCVWCAPCQRYMEKLPSAPAFAVHGFNAKNGYAK